MPNGEGGQEGEKGGIYKGKSPREINVSDIPSERLDKIQREVQEHGIDLNVERDSATGAATAQPDKTAIIPAGAKLPKEKPL